MTYKEARDMIPMVEAQYNTKNFVKSSFTATKWFEKVIEALDKQIPKKHGVGILGSMVCPVCGEYVEYPTDLYCKHCGQAIDYSEDVK